MTSFTGVGSVALAYAAVAVSPGANLLVISRFGIAGRRDEACLAAFGIATGATLMAGASFAGSQWFVPLLSVSGLMQGVFAALLFKLGASALWRAYRRPRLETARATIGRRFSKIGARLKFGLAFDSLPASASENCPASQPIGGGGAGELKAASRVAPRAIFLPIGASDA